MIVFLEYLSIWNLLNYSEQEQTEGFRPNWCVSTIYHAWDTPFWSGTLEIIQKYKTHAYITYKTPKQHMCPENQAQISNQAVKRGKKQ